jgi:hypothetical protein
MADSQEPVRLIELDDTGDRFLIYVDGTGVRVELRHDGDALWMTQAQMAQLFGRDVSVISRHIARVLEDDELAEEGNLQFMQIARSTKPVALYSLDMVISVGYRVSSAQATLFRKWATGVLVRFATSGFVVDVQRLKAPGQQDRIAELREIIRDIRSTEANLYAELRQICALCQDYDPRSEASRTFYQRTQAKLFHAVTNHTPSEIVDGRADAKRPNMGLQIWGKADITKADAGVAKNDLGEGEIRELNRLTTIMLDIFEDQLELGRLTTMAEAQTLLDRQLSGLGRQVLRDGGHVSADEAKAKAAREYALFDTHRKAARKAEADQALAALKATDKALPRTRTPRKPEAH